MKKLLFVPSLLMLLAGCGGAVVEEGSDESSVQQALDDVIVTCGFGTCGDGYYLSSNLCETGPTPH
ncbi:hypothetical protein JQX13_24140 [Archangium violaceum]|uniref:hypothetical protein n=1 Tax=Archangium violaceum TaxID=83451 RepID=UPI00193B7DAF|nr:hypothetical protein [Archangium violaceum]QRK12850.1 hypothetical protein JQX13_24140 [Archangium violaceum]